MQQPSTLDEPPPAPGVPVQERGMTPGRFALVLGAFVLVAFPQVLFGLETFVVRDFGFFVYPLAHYQRECFWRGELPLWNPYNNCGIPFLAQWNTMPLYPPALFYLVLPLSWSLGTFTLLHLFWAGLGMYFLARRWCRDGLGAGIASLVFAFNGFTLNLIMWPSHMATWSWMPWVILCVEQGWRGGGRGLFLATIVGALQMLAGGPEIILFTWVILAGLWVVELVQSRRARAHGKPSVALVSVGCRFPLMVLLVAALAAAQLLPFLDLAAHSQREAGFADTRWSMPARGWANFLVPVAFGSVSSQGVFFQYGQLWTSSYYAGVCTLILAAFAAWKARVCRVWILMGIAAVGFVLASGDSFAFSSHLRHLVPQLSLITYPVKYVALTVFALPILAAFAVAALREAPGHRSAAAQPQAQNSDLKHLLALAGGAVALIAVVLIWAWQKPFPADDVPATLRNGVTRVVFLVLVAAVWTLRVSHPRLRQLMPVALLALLWLDLWTHEPRQNPTVSPGVYEPNLARRYLAMSPQPALGGTRAMVAPAAYNQFSQLALKDPAKNLLAKRLGYFADCNHLDQVPKVDGFFSLYPRECGELHSLLYMTTNPCPARLADFLAVSQVTSAEDYVKWEPRQSFLSLATAGQKPVFMNDTNALLAIVGPDFSPDTTVILPAGLENQVPARQASRATVSIGAFTSHRVDLEVQAEESAFVVLAQSYYHRWQALVDGQPSRLFRANYAFQAVAVPPGKHRVQLVYRDSAFRVGAIISGVALLACAAGFLFSRQRLVRVSDPI